MRLPIFKRMHLPEDGSFADDFKTGYYIGQLNPITGQKEGYGIRIYLKEKVEQKPSEEHQQEEHIPNDQIISVYEGEWKDDMRDGQGYEVYPNKDVYAG